MKNKLSINFAVFCLIIISIFSCKKNEDKNNTTATTYGGALYSSKTILDTTFPYPFVDTINISESASAIFIDSLTDPQLWIAVDTVYVNNFGLEENSDSGGVFYYGIDYSDLYLLNMNSNCNWDVRGLGNIPSFTYNYTAPYPEFTGRIPDSMDKNTGVNFPIQFNPFDSVVITILGDVGSTVGAVTKTFYSGTTNFSFSAADMSGFAPSSFGIRNYIYIYAYTHTTQVFGNKEFSFNKTLEYAGGIWVY